MIADRWGVTRPETTRHYPCDDFAPDPVLQAEPFTAAFGGRPQGRIVAVKTGEHLTGAIMGAFMSCVLVPVNGGGYTRRLLKVAQPGGRLIAPLLSVGDLLMARRQPAEPRNARRADRDNLDFRP